MGAFDVNFSTKFFGLNKQDVRRYFQELEKEQKKIADELEKKKKQLEREEEKLLSELLEAKKEIIHYEDEIIESPNAPNELVNDAYKRVEKTTALINMLADEEAAQLAKKASDELAEYDAMIEELQESINENKEKIEAMLTDVLKLLKSNVDSVIHKESPLVDKRELARQALLEKKDIEQISEKLKENQFVTEKGLQERVTADGTSLSSINKLLMFRKKYAPQQENEEEEELIESLTKKKTPRDEFYDLINGFDEDDFRAEPEESGYTKKQPSRSNKLDFLDLFEEEEPQEEKKAVAPPPDKQTKSETEIKEMRNALIIGKIAGEDLLDSQNKVVIPKGKTLTEDDIALAEKEAKLPELIINMVLPK